MALRMASSNTSFSNYVRTTVANPGSGSATYSTSGTNVPITTYSAPPNATQPGSVNTLDTIDEPATTDTRAEVRARTSFGDILIGPAPTSERSEP